MYNEEKLYSVRSLVVVNVLNFQQDLVVMRFIHIELITCSTSKVDTVKVHTHVVRDVTYAKCLEFKVHMYICTLCISLKVQNMYHN
jgi:hypothetical protein